MSIRRLGAGAAAAACLLTLAGCGDTTPNGGGDPVNICDAYDQYSALPQPVPGNATSQLQYAQVFARIIDRIRLDYPDNDGRPIPKHVQDDVKTIKRYIDTYRDQVRAAGSNGDKLAQAFSSLATTQWTTVTSEVAAYSTGTCHNGQPTPT